jgi:hypothetical protein
MAIIDLFQCDPWCHPTQNWLKNATNDISIHEFHNVTRHYVAIKINVVTWFQGNFSYQNSARLTLWAIETGLAS